MATPKEYPIKKIHQFDLSGGMNSQYSAFALKDNECELIQNYNLDHVGSLTKRFGLTTVGIQIVDTKSIQSIYFYRDTGAFDYSNIFVGINYDTGTSRIYMRSGGSWTASRLNVTVDAVPCFAAFISYLFMANGSDYVARTDDGTAWYITPDTAVPALKTKYICVWQDRIYTANENGTNKYPSRLYWSSLPTSTPTITWAITTDYVDINPDDNDQITWIEPFGSKLLIFKNFGLYRWVFGQTEPDKIIDIGTHEGRTVKQKNGMCFFANKSGVYVYSGGFPKLISRKIQKWFNFMTSTNFSTMRAEIDENHYYLFVGDVTVDGIAHTNSMLVYTISLNTWHLETYPSPIKAMAHNDRGTYGGESYPEEIVMGDDDGYVYSKRSESSTAVSSGDSIDKLGTTDKSVNGKIITKEYPLANFPSPSILKMLHFLSSKPKGMLVSYRLDRGEWKSWRDLTTRITSGNLSGRAVTIQFSITDNSNYVSQLEGFTIECQTEQLGRKEDAS